MTERQKLPQSQAEYETAMDASLSHLNDPNMDILETLGVCQEAMTSYVAALREASQDAQAEVSEHFLKLAQDVENGSDFFLTSVLEYRERHFPQA